MFKCYDCGRTFDEPAIVKEPHPYGESVACERMAVCPYCSGSFDEAYTCNDCGDYFFEEELHSSYCLDCIKENWNNPEELFEFSENFTDEGKINEFALEVFGGVEGVNNALKFLIKTLFACDIKNFKDKKRKFIEKHADSLAEVLEEIEKKMGEIGE